MLQTSDVPLNEEQFGSIGDIWQISLSAKINLAHIDLQDRASRQPYVIWWQLFVILMRSSHRY